MGYVNPVILTSINFNPSNLGTSVVTSVPIQRFRSVFFHGIENPASLSFLVQNQGA